MELQKLYVTLAMEMKEYAAGLDDAVGRARSFGDRVRGALGGAVQTAGLAAAAGLTAVMGAGVALGASSVGIATEFQSSMAIMSTAVDPVTLGVSTTAEAMGIMSDAALQVGSDTDLVGVSASTSAEAITGLYKAGLSTNEIFGDMQGYLAGTAELGGALRASIDLAAASELDMVQASDLASITLATFGGHLESEAERADFINAAMNNFVQTADASVASVGDLQAAFVNVGPSAAAMGLGVEDVNVALGILSTRGIAGSEAGTALKSMLVNLQQTTPEVTDTLDALGVSLYDAQGTMYSLPEIIGQLETSMAGMTDEQRQQTIVTLAGSYGMNAMNALLGEGTAGWAAMETAVAGAATMQETAAARTNTLAGAQEALSGVWESFQIQVGTALIPVLTSLADIGGTLLEKYGPKLTAVFETIGEVIGGFIANLQEGMTPLNAFISAFLDFAPPELVERFIELTAAITPAVKAIEGFIEPIIAAVTNFVSFKDVLAALGIVILATVIPAVVSLVVSMAPILLTVGAIIAVVALLRNAWENDWGGIRTKTEQIINFVRPLIENFIKGIKKWWDENGAQIIASVRNMWEQVKLLFETAKQNLQDAIAAIKAFFQGDFEQMERLLKDIWERTWSAIVDTVAKLWTFIGPKFADLLENIKDWFQNDAKEGIKAKVDDILDGLAEWFGKLWEYVGPKFAEMWESLKAWFAERVEDAKQLGRDIIGGIVEGLQAVGHMIQQTIMNFMQAAWDKITSFWEIESPSKRMEGAGEDIGQGMIDGLDAMRPGVTAAMDGIAAAMAVSLEGLADPVERANALFDMLGNLSGLGGGFAGFFTRRTLDPLAARLEGLNTGIEDTVALLADALPENWATLGEGWQRILLQRLAGTGFLAENAEQARARIILGYMEERGRLNAEYIEQQERLAELEEKQAQAAFLKQQLDLLNLIRENNLDTSLLAGLEFGLDADAGALMDAMTAAMEAMIKAAEDALGIHSPSRWAIDTMQNLFGTMARTAEQEAASLRHALTRALDPVLGTAAPGTGGGAVDNSRRATNYGGIHVYGQGRAASPLEALWEMAG